MSKRSYAAMMGGAAPAAARAARIKKGQASAADRRRVNVTAARAVALAVKAQQELRGVDTTIAVADILNTTNTNVDVIPLNLVVPGNGSFNRQGRKIRMKSVRCFGSLACVIGETATTSSLAGVIVRLVVVYDKQPSGVLPTFDTIFGHTLPDGTEASSFLDPLRYDNTSRFRVLRDLRKDFNPMLWNNAGGTVDGQIMVANFDEYIKLPDLETVYSGQSSPQTIADISSGALYFIARASLSTASIGEASVSSSSFARLRYTD